MSKIQSDSLSPKKLSPKDFPNIKRRKLVVSLAGFILQINFHEFEKNSYSKSLLKESIFTTLTNFEVKNPRIIPEALIIISNEEQVTLRKSKQIFVRASTIIKNNVLSTNYDLSINQFLMIVLTKLLTNLFLKNGGFILHASALQTKNGCVIFLGKSGTGKSTIINFAKLKYPILADDSIFIRQESGKFFLYQTPFIEKENWIRKKVEKHSINKIIILKQGKKILSKSINKTLIQKILLKEDSIFTQEAINSEVLKHFVETQSFSELTFPRDKKSVLNYLTTIK